MEKTKTPLSMKVVNFGIQSLEEGLNDFAEAFEAARKRLPFKPRTGVFFTSLEAARNFLTPKRIELLHIIKKRNPRSLYELAKWANRSFSSVTRDVDTLKKHGLVKLSKQKKTPRNNVQPEVGYDAINLWIGI
jgi:predicted transcriptional regulator